MHAVQHRVDGAGLGKDGAETHAGVLALGDGGCQQSEGGSDEFGEVEVGRGLERLAMPEDADEAHRIIAEDRSLLRRQLAAAEDEAVDAFRALQARGEEAVAERAFVAVTRAADGEREPVLDQLGDAEDRLRRPVVILHESLHAGQQVRGTVAQRLGDPRLLVEAHHVGRARTQEVQLVADAQEEVVTALESLEIIGPEVVLRRQLIDGGDVELHPGHPDGVLVVTQAADAVLDVGFLIEDGVRVLRAPGGLIVEPRLDVLPWVLGRVVAAVGLGEGVVELLRARDAACLEQRGLGEDVLPGLSERLVEGARRVTHLQSAVPQDVEDLVGEVFLQRLGLRRLGLGGEQEHHVDVAERRELAPPVASQRHQRDGWHGALGGRGIAAEGVGEQVDEERVDDLRPLSADRQSRAARLMPLPQRSRLRAQELPASRQPRGHGDLAGKSELFAGADGDVGGHGSRVEWITIHPRGRGFQPPKHESRIGIGRGPARPAFTVTEPAGSGRFCPGFRRQEDRPATPSRIRRPRSAAG